MAKELKLPQISEDADSAQVSEILVSEGDTIKEEQSIIAVETDKASVEVPATAGGTVKEIKVKEGDEISVGDVILILEEDEEDESPEEDQEEMEDEDSQEEEKKRADDEDDEDDEEITAEDESRESAKEEDSKSDEKGKGKMEKKKEKTPKDKEKKEERQPEQESKDKKDDRDVPAAPGVRRFARELGVEIRQVKGSGKGGRISDEDVKRHVRENKGETGSPAALPDFSKWGEVERKPLSGIRKTVAKSTANSWTTIPHVTHFDEANLQNLEEYLEKHQTKAEEKGAKLSMTAILTKIAAVALQRFPNFNASLDMENREIIYKKYINIGIAADTEKGLLIPVVKDVAQKDLSTLSKEIKSLAKKARKQDLSQKDMQGGTFVISNLGGIGGTQFTPIIYHPQVAILGMSRSYVKPVYDDGQFKPQSTLPLSLSYDHRLIDGAEAARFLRWICLAIEDPFEALLG
ncbi:2-oxo acid dehydrogenase subunit E2 [Litoribacter populi]|uniref:2-oxo acid dehydrogenase subunit E2 n=1 Tax=Litoribacter populi TaxID=2598460 RepID=UPI00117DECB7|nr:2-oxo acid dehydrogenase subunit E2 [Litoribacter populi]